MSESKETIKYEVCFIKNAEVTENLKLAFEDMDSNQLDPIWLPEEECLKFDKKEPKLFVMDPFQGNIFDHLKSIQCRIVGPLCILYCLQRGDVLPKRPHPIYSVSFRKITVSCSNIDNVRREDIFRKVELMGGFFSKDFTKSVTHLIVGEVGSKKYQVAANFGLPIMIPDWVDEVWSNGQHKQIHASDSCYNKYKCPIFKGLVVTVSQLSTEERSAIQSIVESHGGIYLPPLKAHETTHLVLSEPIGDKYRYAKTWKVYCVNVNWIYESVEAGYCKDENLYKIESLSKTTDQPNRSTPNRDLTFELPPVDCSVINNVCVVSHLDETMKSDISVAVNDKKNVKSSALDNFDLSSLPKYGQFLDGCKIFLSGFSASHLDKLRKIVNAGGGMRFNKYTDSVTHIVCDELANDMKEMVKSSSVKAYVVSSDWLVECCKKEQLIDEKPFLFVDLTMLSPEKKEPDSPKMSLNSSSSSQARKDSLPLPNDNINDIFNQYMPKSSQRQTNNNIDDCKELKNRNDATDRNSRTQGHKSSIADVYDVDAEVIDLVDDEPTPSVAALFSGLKFIVAGFGEKDADVLIRMIESYSGLVLPSDSEIIADIAIVPIIKHSYDLKASNIITNCWLQKCIEDSRIYDFSENALFTPIEIHFGKKPFASFVISVSQYSGTERDCLMHLAEVMGATCQEYFVRKANKSRGILSNTHLIVSSPEGNKYEAAKKWKIPAVSKQWILDTAKSGVAPSVNEYLIENCFTSTLNSSSSTVSKSRISENKSASHNHQQPDDSHMFPVINNYNKNEVDKKESLPGPSTSRGKLELSTEDKISPILPKAIERIMSPMLSKTNKLLSPLISKLENSMNESCESFDLNSSYKHKFRVSGLLKELDSTHDQSNSMRKHSLPMEELFGKNLASAVKGLNCTMNSESEISNLDFDNNLNEKQSFCEDEDKIFKGVVVCVSKKLSNLQHELNEIVASLGGDYLWIFDNSCTHFVFTGKANDISKDFREAKSSGKKIVCPEWIYACKEKNCLLDETLYPHTLKFNMSLTNEIAIVKSNNIRNSTEKENLTVVEKEQNKKDLVIENIVDFNKELNELLVAAKSAKKRNSRRLVNSVSCSPINEVIKIQRPVSDSFVKPICLEENAPGDAEPDTGSQLSQPYPYVWDDPTERQEREKIAAKTAATNPQIHPKNIEHGMKFKAGDDTKSKPKVTAITEVQNISIKRHSTENKNTTMKACVKKFMFTNIPDPKKSKFISIIEELGGEVSDEKVFDITATHLILEKPIKNEKLLSSIASGKWVLHPQFLIASEEQNMFLNEENFEWGGISTPEFAQNLPALSKKIAGCPSRWRIKLSGDQSKTGAFHNWKVVIIAEDKNKQSNYSKILGAGGAEIIPYESCDNALDRITHVIIEMKKRTLSQIDLSPFISDSIKCVKPEYIAFYLIDDPPPNIDNYIIPEAKELLDNSLTSSKRRSSCLSVTTRGSKRSKVS